MEWIMSLINQMLRDLQSHSKAGAGTHNRTACGVATQNSSLKKHLVAGCGGLIFLGMTWLASDLILGTNQRPTGTDKNHQQEQPAPANAQARNAVAEQSSGKMQNLPVPARHVPTRVGGDNVPGSDPAEPPANSAAPVDAQQKTSPLLAPLVHAPEPGVGTPSPLLRPNLTKAITPVTSGNVLDIPNALTEEEAILASFDTADQAYLAGKRALLEGSNNEQAIKYLRQALELDAGHLLARDLLAEVYHKVSRRDAAAMDLLREGIEVRPDHAGFTKKYSRLLADHGDYAAAVKVLLRGGLPAIKNDAEALEFLATLYTRLKEPYLAAQTYRNLIATWPQNGDYWFALGAVLEGQGQPAEAIKCYRKALDSNYLRRDLKDQAIRQLALLVSASPR
jgi:Tfp pilus assembly protein PilF